MNLFRRSGLPSVNTPHRRTGYIKGVGLLLLILVIGALVAGFTEMPLTPVTLNNPGQRETQAFKAQWKAGNIVVLIRHAQRCDRSSNPCLGPTDGITESGREEAVRVGSAFATLGIGNADIFSSPLTRTVQTARAMFDIPGVAQAWLHDCDSHMASDIKARKVAGRNLVLVTHSNCIATLEAQMGFAHANAADYTSTLVAALGADGTLTALGIVNAQDWEKLMVK